MRALCEHWRDHYDWRKHEAELNRHPQFMCEVDGLDIHFLHVRGKGPAPIPLVLTHGWPGSVLEFVHLIGPLTDPAAYGGDAGDAFDVVIPALPGYGFSGKPREVGWTPRRIAAAFDHLMVKELGYARYGAQGGDWGGFVTTMLGAEHAKHLIGIHLNLAFPLPPPGEEDTEEARAIQAQRAEWQKKEAGYSHEQGTKPMSLAVAQADSPAGIAAWVVEKFRTWSDCEGEVERVFSKDWLLTNLMFYWAPNSIASAASLYSEAMQEGQLAKAPSEPVRVPTAIAAFPKEIMPMPERWCRAWFDLRRYTEMPRGGHFAAVEAPELFLDDVRAFFRARR
ncbi:epoxide hydrolase family protein [Chondromyces apiculatus]|uniref:epoxide hydrolase family protein n=1 Tax=Chondromyces apiculatus TaxID=51 RepID=UPI001E40DD49|nr:epoxide hydrolase family protein [Chondromyces apiculatus]